MKKGCMGPTAGLNILQKEKIFCPWQDANPDHPAHGSVTTPTELSQLLILFVVIMNV